MNTITQQDKTGSLLHPLTVCLYLLDDLHDWFLCIDGEFCILLRLLRYKQPSLRQLKTILSWIKSN